VLERVIGASPVILWYARDRGRGPCSPAEHHGIPDVETGEDAREIGIVRVIREDLFRRADRANPVDDVGGAHHVTPSAQARRKRETDGGRIISSVTGQRFQGSV
jgi:hypothetical protein